MNPPTPPPPPIQPVSPLPPAAPPPPSSPPAAKQTKPWLIVLLVAGGLFVILIPIVAILAGMLLPALGNAKEKAQRIQCVNNLKMLGLAVRIYATDNEEKYPKSWDECQTEIGSPKVLHCPGDKTRGVPSTFEQAVSQTPYAYLGTGASETNLTRIITICPIHNNVLLADGSVHQLPKGATGRIVEEGGHKHLR